MSKLIRKIANDYKINPKALKRYVKEDTGKKIKKLSKIEILEVVFVNAPDLFYCRADEEKGIVEYLDIDLTKKLCKELKELRG